LKSAIIEECQRRKSGVRVVILFSGFFLLCAERKFFATDPRYSYTLSAFIPKTGRVNAELPLKITLHPKRKIVTNS
jgi:hypothetical protein